MTATGDRSRPNVSVVVPFAGDASAAAAALTLLRSLDIEPGDELILADNCGLLGAEQPDVTVVRADTERSPAHARNTGARAAHNAWILFVDADTHAPPDLLARFFAEPIADTVGAITGDIAGFIGRPTLAARYGAAATSSVSARTSPTRTSRAQPAPTCWCDVRRSLRSTGTSRESAQQRTPTSPGGSRMPAGRSGFGPKRSSATSTREA